MNVKQFVSRVNEQYSELAEGLKEKAKMGQMGFSKDGKDWGQGPGIG